MRSRSRACINADPGVNGCLGPASDEGGCNNQVNIKLLLYKPGTSPYVHWLTTWGSGVQ